MITYNVDQACWCSFVLSTFGVKQDTLAGLLCPGSVVVTLMLLSLDIRIESVSRKRLLAQPEEVLDETELPRRVRVGV